MRSYILKRLALLVPIILGIIFIVFFINSLTPISPGRIILGGQAKQADVDKIDSELGYNSPFLVKYINYVGNLVRGDLGKTYYTKRPVIEEIIKRFPVTFNLAFFSMLLACIIGIPIGVYSAVKQYSLLDYTGTSIAMFLSVIPPFWFALVLMLFLSLQLHILPSSGASSPQAFIMPVVVTALGAMAGLMRMTRATMLETIRTDYVRTARAKGLTEKRVIWFHALKNALLPVITLVGMNFGMTLGGTVITEIIFSMPGLGMLTVNAIRNNDIPQVMGIVLFFSIIFLLIMLSIDVLYAYIDPRIKALYEAKEENQIRKNKGTFLQLLKRRVKRLVG